MKRFACLLCALLLALFIAAPHRAIAAEDPVSVRITSPDEFMSALDAAKRSEMAMRIEVKGRIVLLERAKIAANTQIVVHEGDSLVIAGANGKLTNDGTLLISGGALRIEEDGRLLNYGQMHLQAAEVQIAGTLRCCDSGDLKGDADSNVKVLKGGSLEIRKDAKLLLQREVENAGRVDAETEFDAGNGVFICNREGGKCSGLPLSCQYGWAEARNMEDLKELQRAAEVNPERRYLGCLVRSVRVREPFQLPQNLCLSLESSLEILSGGRVLALGDLQLQAGDLIIRNGGELVLCGKIEEREGALQQEENSRLTEPAVLRVSAPGQTQYDLAADGKWNLEGGQAELLAEDGSILAQRPLTENMLPDFAQLSREMGVQGVFVRWGDRILEDAFFIEWVENLSLTEVFERGLAIEGEGISEDTVLRIRRISEREELRLLTAAFEQGASQESCTTAHAELINARTGMAYTFRFYPKAEQRNGKWLFLQIAEDGSVCAQEILFNGRSLSVQAEFLGSFALAFVPDPETKTDGTKRDAQPSQTTMETQKTDPDISAADQTGQDGSVPGEQLTLFSQDEDAPAPEVLKALGLGLGALFLLLIGAAFVIMLRGGTGKRDA